MIRRLCPLLLLAALPLWPASKEILDLQRDVANLQELVRQLLQAQGAQTQQLTAFGVLVQQALDSSKSADRSLAGIQSNIQQTLNDQKKEVVAPVVGLSTRMDQVSNDVRTLQQAVADLTSSMSHMHDQLTDINNALKVLQSPPVAPPSATVGGGVPGSNGSVQSNVPPMSATDLYTSAQNDRNSGKLDLSLQEFSDYMKYYPTADLAGNAQFYIGWIHYSQGAFDTAASDFDAVLEKFPDNLKASDGEANFYKGESLKKAGKRTQSRTEFDAAIKAGSRAHNDAGRDVTQRACDELKDMGFTCPTGAAAPKANSKKKR